MKIFPATSSIMRCTARAIPVNAEQSAKEIDYLPDEFLEPIFRVAHMIASCVDNRAEHRSALIAFTVAVIVGMSGCGHCFAAYRTNSKIGASGFFAALIMIARQ